MTPRPERIHRRWRWALLVEPDVPGGRTDSLKRLAAGRSCDIARDNSALVRVGLNTARGSFPLPDETAMESIPPERRTRKNCAVSFAFVVVRVRLLFVDR